MNRYSLRLVERPSTAAAHPLSVNHKIALTDDGDGLALLLADRLKAMRYRAEVVSEVPPSADLLICLDPLRREANAGETSSALFSHAQRVSERFLHKGGQLIIVQDTGGSFGLHEMPVCSAWTASGSGLIKTAAQEWPKARCKAIDIDREGLSLAQIAERLLFEIVSADALAECALARDGKRLTIETYLSQPLKKIRSPLKKGDVIIVSGGAKGVTAACILALAKEEKLKIAIFGRTPLEPHHPVLTAFREEGKCECAYFPLDITDAQKVEKTVQEIRHKWGDIKGIVHGAGTIADKFISQKTKEQFSLVFDTKVRGLQNLLSATQADPLTLIVLFSSVAARLGNAGQCDYSMANEVLNKVARAEKQKRGNNCHVKALNWGPWEGGMVTPALQKLFARRNIPLLSLERGAELFIQELFLPEDVEVLLHAT